MPLWLTIAIAIIIHSLLFLQWSEAYSIYKQINRYGGTVTIGWAFLASHAAAIVFWCWVIFG